MKRKILIIDDNEQFCESLNTILGTRGFLVEQSHNSSCAFFLLKQKQIDLILLDVRLGDENGPDVLVRLKSEYPFIPVVMLTGFGTIESAVHSIKLGAYDYIQKPVKFSDLLQVIDNALTTDSDDAGDLPPLEILSQDSKTLEIIETINKLAPANIPILLQGENGIGKEMFADYIHSRSNRQKDKFIKINCASFTDSLLDNELFGHDKGAYTGADSLYKGVFERSDKGTLFLDEIGDMSLNVQSKVLRVLQNKELFRLGGHDLVNVDIRIIAASNKNLEDLIKENKFRQDLYYRLNAATINIPSLRERKEDIPDLADFFIESFSRENRKNVKGMSREVLERFYSHNWPGNIRELKNIISYAVAVSVGPRIEIGDLPEKFMNITDEAEGETLLERSEKTVLLEELKRFHFNKKKAAESLNISRSTLYSKMKKYEITI
jgi:DNA-binding NtrC family response regulator